MSTGSDQHDPFPRDQAVELVKRLPAYAKLALAVGRDNALPATKRAALLGAGAYVISPVGLVPGFVPLVGQLDDLWVLLRALRFALDGLPPLTRAEYLEQAGISTGDLDSDFDSVNQLVSWTARRGRRSAVRAAAGGLRFGRKLAARAERIGDDVAQRIQERRSAGSE